MKRTPAKRLLELCRPRTPIVPNTVPDQVCEIVAEMLTQRTEETNLLMQLVLDRYQARTFPGVKSQFSEAVIERWLDSMETFSRATVKAKEHLVSSITARIRLQHRRELASSMQAFVNQAAPEDVRLMLSILTWWDGVGGHTENGEIPLARAFEEELGNDATRVAVPAEMVEDVVQFIRWQSSIAKTEATNGRSC